MTQGLAERIAEDRYFGYGPVRYWRHERGGWAVQGLNCYDRIVTIRVSRSKLKAYLAAKQSR